MSVSPASTNQSITSTLLQQLLSGSNAQATSSLSPAVLKDVLASASSTTQSAPVPAAVTQALGNLLSGNDKANPQSDLSTLQSYFKQNPDQLTSLLGSLQSSGTYSANGSVSGSNSNALPAAVTQSLGSLLSGSDSTNDTSDLSTVQSYFKQNPDSLTGLLSSLQNLGNASGTSNASLISQLLGSQSQDPLLAALGGSSSSGSTFSMLG